MKRVGWLVAVGLVVVADAIALGGAALNRQDDPEAEVELTERELPMSWRREEDTGISLRLRWSAEGQADWFDRAKLEETGFDCSPPIDARTQEIHYAKLLPRDVFVVLEYGGASWARWLEREEAEIAERAEEVERGEALPEQLETAKELFERARATRTRLFAVDAGLEAEALRQRYPDRGRFLILPAVAQVDRYHLASERELRGEIRRILVDRVHVPRRLRPPLESLGQDSPWEEREPRYRVVLAVGHRYEPWIRAVEPLG